MTDYRVSSLPQWAMVQRTGTPSIFGLGSSVVVSRTTIDFEEFENDLFQSFPNDDAPLNRLVNFEDLSPIKIQALELQSLHESSGLTWKQLAALFAVVVRYIHYWVDGGRPMKNEHTEFMHQLTKIINTLNLGTSFKVRRFFEDHVFSNDYVLRKFNARDYAFIDKWIQDFISKSSTNKFPVSHELINSRTSGSPAPLEDTEKSTDHNPVGRKSRPIKIGRPRG